MNPPDRLRRLAGAVQSTWNVVGITVLLFAGLELAASLWYRVRRPPPALVLEAGKSEAVDLDARFDSADLNAHERDAKRCAESTGRPYMTRWNPYTYWRRLPCRTPTINVDSRGVRLTVQPQTTSPKLRIFLFGGSTMWGTGVSDANTIPSLLARELQDRGLRDFELTNFGEFAFVNTQELLTLMLELRDGNVPSVAVFYDGVNEVFSSAVNGRPGLTQREIELASNYYLPAEKRNTTAISALLARSSLVEALRGLRTKLVPAAQTAPRALAASDPTAARLPEDQLVKQTADFYFANLGTIVALSKLHGFRPLFFFQPTLTTKAALSTVEKELLAEYERHHHETVSLTRAVYREVTNRQAEAPKELRLLTDALDQIPTTVFFDNCHLTEKGNRAIAQRLAPFVLTAVRSNGSAVTN